MASDKQASPLAALRLKALTVVNHRYFTSTVIVVILLNAVVIGIETSQALFAAYYDWFHWIDRIFLLIFSVEIALKLFATRPMYRFFNNGWNVFDFLIVAAGLLFAGGHLVSVLRILRVLRVLRAFTVIPSLQKLVSALFRTIPALGNISLLMGLIFYIFGVMGTFLFAETAPEYFGTLGLSLLTLFQVVTLESWASGVMRPIFADVPWSWVYFVSFVLVGTFVIFNLFVGVIVNNVQKEDEDEQSPALPSDPVRDDGKPDGRDTAGRDAAGRDAAGRDAAGRDAAGRDAAGRDAAGRDTAAQSPDRTEAELAALRREIQELKALIVSRQRED